LVNRGRPPKSDYSGAVAVSARGLVKSYGEIHAVRAIDLEVQSGEIFGFLGPNGAGKSTTISMLCTLLTPTAGTAQVAGFDVVHQRDDVRRHIGLVFQDQTLDGYLSAQMTCVFMASCMGCRVRFSRTESSAS